MQEETTEKTVEDERIENKAADTQDSFANRGAFLKCVAGIYLIYTAYELADSYLKKEEGSSLGFCVAGIVFGIIGVFLLYIVIRDYLRDNKQKNAESAMQAKISGTEAKIPGTGEKPSVTDAKPSGTETSVPETGEKLP